MCRPMCTFAHKEYCFKNLYKKSNLAIDTHDTQFIEKQGNFFFTAT